ncbi:MAG: hypothetical protein IJG87_00705 [Ruminococcus sp.]|nr:hypothetical protein [Ruminococcus sp.]
MKKPYACPELEIKKLKLGTDICSSLVSSAETPIIDIIETEDLDDI